MILTINFESQRLANCFTVILISSQLFVETIGEVTDKPILTLIIDRCFKS